MKRRLREAKFPLLKTLDTFDYQAAPGLDRRLLHQLASGAYISQHRNVIFLGKSGTGKTHLATGLGVEACRQGITTRFVTGCGLANKLLEARQGLTLSRIINRYARYGMLLVDELGYVPFSKEGAELLFQVLAERHERRSVIITSNLGFADWTQIFGEPTLTAALLDRLTHKAHIVTCDWESYRLKKAWRAKAPAPAKGEKSPRKPLFPVNAGAPPPHPRSLTLWRPPERQEKRQGKMPCLSVWPPAAALRLLSSSALSSAQATNSLSKSKGKGGQFWVVARGHFSVVITKGIVADYRRQFWRQLVGVYRRNPSRMTRYLNQCALGENLFPIRESLLAGVSRSGIDKMHGLTGCPGC